jgi:hypothetical protein
VICDVLQYRVSRSYFANDSSELGPEVPFVVCTSLRARDGERLTWVSSANNVNGGEVSSSDIFHILIAGSVGPVLREHRPTVGVLLDLPHHRAKASAFQSEL